MTGIRDHYLEQIDQARASLDRLAGEVREYTCAGEVVTCHVLRSNLFGQSCVFAGACGRRTVFISDAIPNECRYPVVVHEYVEARVVLDALQDCADFTDLRALQRRAHEAAMQAEAEAAHATGISEQYYDFRLSSYRKNITHAGGASTWLGHDYMHQRRLFERAYVQAATGDVCGVVWGASPRATRST